MKKIIIGSGIVIILFAASWAVYVFIRTYRGAEEGNYENRKPELGEIELKEMNENDSLRDLESLRRDIALPQPVPIADADRILREMRSKGENPKEFIIAFGDYQMLYTIQENETISGIVEREISNLLDMLQQNRKSALNYDFADKENT